MMLALAHFHDILFLLHFGPLVNNFLNLPLFMIHQLLYVGDLVTFTITWPVPILEVKGSLQNIQKGHPNMVIQADIILQNWWEFKY